MRYEILQDENRWKTSPPWLNNEISNPIDQPSAIFIHATYPFLLSPRSWIILSTVPRIVIPATSSSFPTRRSAMWGSEPSGGRLRSRPWVLESFHGCWRWFTGLGRPPTLFAAAKGRNTGPFATEISDVIGRFARFVFPLSIRGSLDTRNDYESPSFAPVHLPVEMIPLPWFSHLTWFRRCNRVGTIFRKIK